MKGITLSIIIFTLAGCSTLDYDVVKQGVAVVPVPGVDRNEAVIIAQKALQNSQQQKYFRYKPFAVIEINEYCDEGEKECLLLDAGLLPKKPGLEYTKGIWFVSFKSNDIIGTFFGLMPWLRVPYRVEISKETGKVLSSGVSK